MHRATVARGTAERAPAAGDDLRTPRLRLRAPVESDRDEFCRVLEISRDHLEQWMPLQNPGESSAQAFERALYLADNGDATRSAWRRIGVTPSGRIVGGCAIYALQRGLVMEGCMHWWVSADATCRGFGVEIVSAALAHAIADLPDGLGLHKVVASIDPANDASIALAIRAGFIREGRGRHPVQVGDRWVRHDEYAYHAPIALDQGDPAGGSAGSAGAGELVSIGAAVIPGRGWIVPSLATRS